LWAEELIVDTATKLGTNSCEKTGAVGYDYTGRPPRFTLGITAMAHNDGLLVNVRAVRLPNLHEVATNLIVL